MNLNNIYNFRNPVRHFISIDHLDYPTDIQSFDPIEKLCWTKPMSFRIYKADDRFRIIKIPNILNFVRAYHYYRGLPHFANIQKMDFKYKRLAANLDTGDFVSGNYNSQLDNDFIQLCNYDVLLKLDISEFYGRIYTHYLDLDNFDLNDHLLAWLNNGRTSGVLMGNYLSLYFAEYILSRISIELDSYLKSELIDCFFNYFSDDFYFFCNKNDQEKILKVFDKVLGKFDFTRKEKKEVWTYETYNEYNLLTRYWKAIIRTWNLEIIKDYENNNKHPDNKLKHRFSFLNQIVYRLSGLQDEKSKRSLIVNFFKTHHFQTCDYSDYVIQSYDLHQLFFLVKCAPESLLYIAHVIKDIDDIKDNPSTKTFLKARFKEALRADLHDVQLYYYYAIKVLGFDDVIQEMNALVIESQNQVLISYYLKDDEFTPEQKDSLKLLNSEEYWFQNYHLILYTLTLKSDLQNSVQKYLIPERLQIKPNNDKEKIYRDFYMRNIQSGNELIRSIADTTLSIRDYLNQRYEETKVDFED